MTSTRQPQTRLLTDQRRRREQKLPVDPWKPNGWLREDERGADGQCRPTLTLFLTGTECPFDCVFCDLWRQTLDGPTPRGAIPRQLATGLSQTREPAATAVKLYNASNFFDPVAVPPEDDAESASLLRPFRRVIVESHPRFIGQRCLEFSDRLDGGLEVAIGLETADPDVLARLNKQMTLEMVADAAATLRMAQIGLRIFLLVPPPFVDSEEVVVSTQRAVSYAASLGADHVSLIPTRTDHIREGAVVRPTLGLVEDALEACGYHDTTGMVVSVDTWDLDALAICEHCGPARIDRLRKINLTGHPVERITCSACTS